MADVTHRYAVYCRGNGLTPDEQQAADRKAWPMAPALPFGSWCRSRWAEFRGSRGMRLDAPISDAMQAEFETWLEGERG